MTVRRTFWILSIANWLLAVAVWSVSAYLGIARPTSLFIPTTLFVIGIFAVLAGTLCWVVARFGQPPEPAAAEASAAAPARAEVTTAEVTTAEAAPAESMAAAPARPEPASAGLAQPELTAADTVVSPVAGPGAAAVPGEPASAAEQPLPAEAG